MDNETRKMIEEFKDKAEYFLENNIRAFIKDKEDTWYFCNILLVEETCIIVNNFEGMRKGEDDRILFIDIKSFKDYRGDSK